MDQSSARLVETGFYTTVIARFSGEITLKSEPVRRRMMDRLATSIRDGLHRTGFPAGQVHVTRSRIVIDLPAPGLALPCAAVLERTPGIVSFSFCKAVPSTLPAMDAAIVALASEVLGQGSSLAVRVTREGKHQFSSPALAAGLGATVITSREPGTTPVDLVNPGVTLHVEVRHDIAYLFHQKLPGPGGMPRDTSNIVLAVTGVAEAEWVACKLLATRGVGLLPVIVVDGVAADEDLAGALNSDASIISGFTRLARLQGPAGGQAVAVPVPSWVLELARREDGVLARVLFELLLANELVRVRGGAGLPGRGAIKGCVASCCAVAAPQGLHVAGIARVMALLAACLPAGGRVVPPLVPVDVCAPVMAREQECPVPGVDIAARVHDAVAGAVARARAVAFDDVAGRFLASR